MESWNGMEWVFGMEYGMKILSNNFGVKVKNVISWDVRDHSHDNTDCWVLTQVQTSNMKLWQSSSKHSRNDINTRVIIQILCVITRTPNNAKIWQNNTMESLFYSAKYRTFSRNTRIISHSNVKCLHKKRNITRYFEKCRSRFMFSGTFSRDCAKYLR